ncbi:MAG: cell division protein FtsZ [Acholeplasmatales bacterium]|nr:cell division protein FtsZ [Acholeplasmatales bacterium]
MIFDDLDNLSSARTKIKVIGVGGAGKNAIDHMIENEVMGVEFFVVNTDAQDLKASSCQNRLLIGKTTTHGQGAGANPEVGRAAALESEDDIHEMIGDAQMVFITCGMGGGTGTGAAPVVAKVARDHKCLTVGICTKPFFFEGPQRMDNAAKGLENLRKYVDTLIVIPNQRLLQMVDVSTNMYQAFREADNVLRKGVQGIAEVITVPGMINLDFADVRSVMQNKGTALMGIGVATGPNRAREAAINAIHSALLEVTIDGATDAIVNITASRSLTLHEVNDAVEEIRNNSGKNLNVIFGAAVNSDLNDEIVVTVVATGYELKAQENGYADISSDIYRHMNDDNITINYADSDEEEAEPDVINPNDKLKQIFTNIDPKGEKKRLKEEKKRLKEEKKRKQQDLKETPTKEVSSSKLPDWLRRE